MIIWFSGSGNSLSVARKLAEATQDTLLHLNDAPAADLSGEKVIGLVYPTYSYDAPLKIKELLGSIRFPQDAYLWIVVTCGSTPGNSIFCCSGQRVNAIKGGSWDSPRMSCRTEYRAEGRNPSSRCPNVGFRVVRESNNQ